MKADGIGPARVLADEGAAITLGSDSHAVIDLLEEARRVELGERLASGERGHFSAAELAAAATAAGHASLGWPDAGELAAGALADFVTVALDSPRTAGVPARRRWCPAPSPTASPRWRSRQAEAGAPGANPPNRRL